MWFKIVRYVICVCLNFKKDINIIKLKEVWYVNFWYLRLFGE